MSSVPTSREKSSPPAKTPPIKGTCADPDTRCYVPPPAGKVVKASRDHRSPTRSFSTTDSTTVDMRLELVVVEVLGTEATEIWESCSEAIKSQVSDVVWQVTFSSVQAVAIEGDRLLLQVPSTVVRDRIEGRYRELVDETLAELSDDRLGLTLEVAPRTNFPADVFDEMGVTAPEDESTGIELLDDSSSPTDGKAGGLPIDQLSQATPTPFVDEFRYTFDNFVVGPSNRFAHAAAQAVAETPGRSYTPLFIYGDAGLGKTHLLQAVGRFVRDHYPNHQVRYVSSEDFMNRFVEAIRNKTLPEFKQHFREVDVLLVDDIQFLAGKEGLQEEFFHTFNTIQQAGGQIVLSSDRLPDSIPTLEARLVSRFKMGLVTDVKPADLETRLAILSKKAEHAPSGIEVSDEVMQFIAENITENIRELEGALTRVVAYSSLNAEPCTRDLAIGVLGDLISDKTPLPITPELILTKTSELYGFSNEELMGGSRRRPLVTARQVAMYIFRELTDLSYPAIAREFGGRDHTTVIHGVEKIRNLMPERREIYDQVTALISAVRNHD